MKMTLSSKNLGYNCEESSPSDLTDNSCENAFSSDEFAILKSTSIGTASKKTPRIALLQHFDNTRPLHSRKNQNSIRATIQDYLGIQDIGRSDADRIQSWEWVLDQLKIDESLSDRGVTVYDYQNSSVSDQKALYKEFLDCLDLYNQQAHSRSETGIEMESAVLSDDTPLPQRIIHIAKRHLRQFPQIAKILTVGRAIVSASDAIILPGGYHISPLVYGQPIIDKDPLYNRVDQDLIPNLQREMLEFTLINLCESMGKPILAICRGHQALNIYYGATLVVDKISGSERNVIRDVTQRQASYYLGDLPEKAHFIHEQMVRSSHASREQLITLTSGVDLVPYLEAKIDRLNEEIANTQHPDRQQRLLADQIFQLTTLIDYLKSHDIAISVESIKGAPIVGCQYHPEAFYARQRDVKLNEHLNEGVAQDNLRLIRNFVDLAKIRALKSEVVADIKRSVATWH